MLSVTGFLAQCHQLVFDMDLFDTTTSPPATPSTTPPSQPPPRFINKPSYRGVNVDSWPERGSLVPVTIVSLEELCGLWERVIRRLSEAPHAMEWRMSSESYGDATRVLTTLQDRWEELMVGEEEASGANAEEVSMTLPSITSVNKVLRLLDHMRDKDLAREDLHVLPRPPPQELEIGLNLQPPAKLELELSLQLEGGQGLEQASSGVLSQAAMSLSRPSTFSGDDSLYDPNEWFVSPEEVPVPRDPILDGGPKSRRRLTSIAEVSTDKVEMVTSPTPTGHPGQGSAACSLYSSSPTNTVSKSGKVTLEGHVVSWMGILREQQEQGQRQMQEQINKLQQQLQTIQLQYDQQHQLLTNLEEKQQPQQQQQTQLKGKLEELVKRNEQVELERQEEMEDLLEELLWQQEQLANWEELRQEGVYVQQSDFERLELQFERLQKHYKQQQQDGAGVKRSDFKRLELQFERLRREQKQPMPSLNNIQQQKSSQSPDQKKFQQLYSDHQHLETKYRQLKQEFDRQAEKQRRHWERQQQIEHQLTKHQGIIQGHKLQVRQMLSGQKMQTTQYLRRIDELEEQLAQLQKSYDTLAASSQSRPPRSAVVLAEVKPATQEQSVFLSEPSSTKKQKATTSTVHSPLTWNKGTRTMRTPYRRGVYSSSTSGFSSPDTTSKSVKDPDTTGSDQNSSDDDNDKAGSEAEAEAKEETDSQSTVTNDTRSVRRSRRRSHGEESEVVPPEVPVVTDTLKDDRSVGRRPRGRKPLIRKDEMVHPPPPKRGRGRPRLTDEQRKAAIERRRKVPPPPVEILEENEEEEEEEEERRSDSEEDEDEAEVKEERQMPVRRPTPVRRPMSNTKVLRSRPSIAAPLATGPKRVARPSKQRQEATTTRAVTPPKTRLPLLPKKVGTKSSSASNVSNFHPTTNANSSSNIIVAGINKHGSKGAIGTSKTSLSDNDHNERSKENPRKRSASVLPPTSASIAKRRLMSLRSSGFMDVATRTRSSGAVRTYHEMLGPNVPKSLRI
ncbi:hypothetical protein BGW39_002652 [Mortierella sp. 14UC]|nr:hypothetical protein BGW39_002652 [Mortierella sp. 14UC]